MICRGTKCPLTIVVPVYNGAKFLVRCIESILVQSFSNFECLLLDDGSTDDSLSILNKYSLQDARIRVIQGENVGVARVRNNSIDIANGEYIVFLDQDDYLDPDYCEIHLKYTIENDWDVAMSGYRRPDDKGKIRKEIRPSAGSFYKYTVMAAWAKIHRTDFLRRNNIRFFESKMGEDVVFTLQEIKCSDKMGSIDYIGYNWYDNDESVSNTSFKSLVKNYDSIMNLLERCRLYAIDDLYFEYYLVRQVVFLILSCGKYDKRSDFLLYSEKIFDWLKGHYPLFEKNKYISRFPEGESALTTSITIRFFIFIRKIKLLSLFALLYCKGK
jgi:glycosyltransferase involved in cell wall biosynthesis